MTAPQTGSQRVTASDALMWDIEADPVLRSTVLGIALLDRSPDWQQLRDRLDAGARSIPKMHRTIRPPRMGVGAHRWVDDDRFDLEYHLRRVRASGSGDITDLLAMVAPMLSTPFDLRRPPWEFTLVEGLAGGRAALIQKFHHSVTDGIGGIEIALMLVDHPERNGMVTSAPDGGRSDPRTNGSWAERGKRAARIGRDLATGAAWAATRPDMVVREGARTLQAAAQLVAPVRSQASPIMRGRSLGRHVVVHDVPLDALRQAGHAVGGTVNDALLAAVIGGMFRYHVDHGRPTPELRITMPVNFRRQGDGEGGNRFAPARFAVPAAIADPRERIRRVGAIAHELSHGRTVALTTPVAGVINAMHPAVKSRLLGGMLKAIDVVISNVPGFPFPVSLGGAGIDRQYAFAPLVGAASSVLLVSHVGTACMGIATDPAAVPDGDHFAACIRNGLDEILAVAM